MKKILVPTDFSECAEHALEAAASIARKTDARLYVLHVMDIPVYNRNDSFQTYSDTAEGLFWMKLVKKRFKELFAKPFLKDINAVQVLQFDGIYDTIATQAQEHEIDLIVMGSHGDSGVHEVFIGSNTEKVVRLANCPVLTIKGKHKDFAPKEIVFASNFYGEAKDNFERISSFVKIFGSHVHLLKVNTPEQFESTPYTYKLIDDFIEATGIKSYTKHIYNERTVHLGIIEFSKQIKADMIAMETHGRTGLSRFFSGSQTEGIVNHANVPVLSLRIKEEKKSNNPFPDFSKI